MERLDVTGGGGLLFDNGVTPFINIHQIGGEFMAVAKAVTKDWVYLQDKAAAASYYSHTRSSSLSNLGTVA